MTITRDQLMATGLPTLNSCFDLIEQDRLSSIDDEDGRSIRLCVIGPTTDELRSYAPRLLQELELHTTDDRYFDFHRPVDETTDLGQVVKEFGAWRSAGFYDLIACIIAPPSDADVRSLQSCDDSILPDEVLVPDVSPALAIAAAREWGGSTYLILPERDLSGPKSEPLRQWLATGVLDPEKWVRSFAMKTQQLTGEMEFYIRPGTALWPKSVWVYGSSSDENVDFDSTDLDLVALAEISYDPGAALPHGFFGSDAVVHFRRLTHVMARDIATNTGAAESLFNGRYGRQSEDDYLIPAIEVLASCQWGAAASDAQLVGFSKLATSQGYPMRSIRDICTSVEKRSSWIHEQSQPGALWFDPESLTARLLPPQDLHDPARKKGSETRPIRLVCQSVQDSEFLWRSINDPVCHVNIKCRAIRGNVPAHILADTLIPWPSEEQRDQILQAIADAKKLVGSGIVADVERACGELPREIQQVAEQLDADGETDHMAISTYEVGFLWADFSKVYHELKKAVEAIPGWCKLAGGEPEAPRARRSFPPAPIAILRRRMDHEREWQAKLTLLFDLAELIVKYDAVVLLATLAEVAPQRVGDVFGALDLAGKKNWGASFGHWRDIQRRARGYLADPPAPSANVSYALNTFRKELCGVNERKIERVTRTLIEERNAGTKGHGYTPSEHERPKIFEELRPYLDRLLAELPYLDAHMLVYVESCQRERKRTVARTRLLMQDNPEFARQDLEFPPGGPMDSVRAHEVYLQYADPDRVLSLYPWVHFAPDRSGRDAVWFLDGINRGAVLYKSPQASEKPLEVAENLEDVRALMGR